MTDWQNKSNMPINERVAQIEQWCRDHEDRHTRDSDTQREALLLAVRNEISLSAASSHPIDAVVKWAAGLVMLVLVALLGWLLKR
jgi:hypothetical protein